jgi:hypothetical protein
MRDRRIRVDRRGESDHGLTNARDEKWGMDRRGENEKKWEVGQITNKEIEEKWGMDRLRRWQTLRGREVRVRCLRGMSCMASKSISIRCLPCWQHHLFYQFVHFSKWTAQLLRGASNFTETAFETPRRREDQFLSTSLGIWRSLNHQDRFTFFLLEPATNSMLFNPTEKHTQQNLSEIVSTWLNSILKKKTCSKICVHMEHLEIT